MSHFYIEEFLVFLIPLIIVEMILLGYTLWHIFTNDSYKHGTRWIWCIIVIIGIQFIGPVLYFIFGKEDE